MRTNGSVLSGVALASVFALGTISAIAAPPKPKPKKPMAPAASAKLTAAGQKLFATNCGGCHVSSDKQDKSGKMGPVLSHVGKFMKPAALESKIRNPRKTKPDSIMPAFGATKIKAPDMKALVAYLSSLK